MKADSQDSTDGSLPPIVGLIGVGLMGTAIGQRLLDQGYQVFAWNRSRDEAQALLDYGAQWSDNPLESCDRVIVSLYSSPIVHEVLQNLQSGFRPGSILIDTTTGDPDDACRASQWLRKYRVGYLEAPVSGSSVQMRTGEAVILVGGDRADYEACVDLWKSLAHAAYYIGPSGSAARMKLITNLVLGLNRAALAEGLTYAQALGVDPATALDVLKHSAAASRVMESKGDKMLRGDFSVQAKLSQHRKDVYLILKTAREAGLDLPLTLTHRQLLDLAQQAGLGELDNSAIISVYRRRTDEQ
ncbi:MAG: NAD(P)-dependent oxidoreductase [Pirellulaceae bacterium]|nr:NAD(P)-dependent oxidoreductase [Pirellulaceae bacterium]